MKKVLKKILKKNIVIKLVKVKYKMINVFCALFPKTNTILLESHPDLSCNTYELFKQMIKNNVNEKYTLVWMVNEPQKYISENQYKNVLFREINPKGFLNRIKHYIFCNRSAAVITSNRIFFPKMCGNKSQLNIFMDHGSPLKDVKTNNEKFKVDCDYIISQSNFFHKALLDQYTIREDQIIVTGLPRNDQLYKKYNSLNKLYEDIHLFERVILWTPTFRYHMRKERIDCNYDMPLGIPIFYSKDNLRKFNNYLLNKKLLLIIKPHPAQDMDLIKDLDFSNIRILLNEQLYKEKIQTNELLTQMDALITDYSSIYYDYLLLGKPIAITLDDYKEYKEQMGFVFENPLEILVGMHIFSEKDMYAFIEKLVSDCDDLKDERNEMIKKIDYYHDDRSSLRVLSIILSELEKRNMVNGRL